MPVHTTACPRNCYSTCGMLVHVDEGRISRIEPHPGNRATPEGVCLKGLSYVERVRSQDRVLHPLQRLEGGDHVRVGWDEAFDLIVQRLVQIRKEWGPKAVMYYAGSGTKGLLNGAGLHFWRSFGGCTTTYGDLCWPAGLEATRLTLGDNRNSAPWDISRARLIIMWGKNAAETNIHQMPFVHDAIEAGARLVVIDPRRTETTEAAHLWLRPRPGTDGALALALGHELVRSRRVDEGFVRDRVLGFGEYASLVERHGPEWASTVTDVPARDIRALAEWLGSIEPATICAGFGMQRYTNSGQTIRAILALLAITGNIGRPGAGWVYANLQTQVFDEVRDPIAFYPPEEPDGEVRVSISTARLGADLLSQTDPPVRMAWIERGNPVTQNPDTNRVLEALRGLEFRVVVDQFLTDTAREADLVLPAKTMFEQTDVIGAYWHPYLQLRQKILEPPGEVKPETEIYWLLGRRLGISESQLAEGMPAPSDEAVEAFLEHRLADFEGLDLETLRRGPVVVPGHEEVAFADGVFDTPSGRIELVSDEAVDRWGTDRLPRYREPEGFATEGDGPASDSLVLMTPNTKNRIHSQFGNLRMIRRLDPEPLVHVHPADASARGITDGMSVRIHNQRGEFTLRCRVDAGLKRGCVSVTNGWWIQDGGTVNFCSPGLETDMGHGAAFHGTLVEVSPA